MKKLDLFLPLLCLVPAACSTSVVNEPETETHAISFRAPQAETRAVVDDTDTLGHFRVWGGYGNSATNVFNGTIVYSPNWDYRDGTRYWTLGKSYNFYAVHPAVLPGESTANVSEEGTITVENFDCSATGADAVDLMTATASRDYNGTDNSAVGLTFQHELARVKFIVSSEGDAITITDAKLYGISRTGDLNGSTWTLDAASSSDSPSFETESLSINDNDTDEHLLFGGDVLLIPQSLTNAATFVFNYQYNGEETHSVSSTLSTVGNVTAWDAGKSYNYRISIPQQPVDVTLTVTVTDWDEENFTVEW